MTTRSRGGPGRRRSACYGGLRRDVLDVAATAREVWSDDGPLVCCLLMPVALMLFLALEVLIRSGLFTRREVQRFFDRNAETARRDEENLKALDRQLANGYHAHLTAEGGFVLRRGGPPRGAAAEQRLRELIGD
jgi:hypothetical protein